jgi:hypothetical protein
VGFFEVISVVHFKTLWNFFFKVPTVRKVDVVKMDSQDLMAVMGYLAKKEVEESQVLVACLVQKEKRYVI